VKRENIGKGGTMSKKRIGQIAREKLKINEIKQQE
jgi:hypothetical protein